MINPHCILLFGIMPYHSTLCIGVVKKHNGLCLRKENSMTLRKCLILLVSLILINLSLFNVSWGNDRNHQQNTFEQHKKIINNSNKELPRGDIQRFVTAIALIHNYYIKNVTNDTLFNNAIRGMIANLDPHSSYLDPEELKELKTTVSGNFVGVGIELTIAKNGLLKVVSPLDNSPAKKAGIQPGDIIIKIDKQLVRDLNLQEAVQRIKGKKGTTVMLTILRKGTEKPLKFTLTRADIHLISVTSKMLEKGYAYVRISFFQGPLEKQLRDTINQLKKESGGQLQGLVLDLRNNPGGLLDASADVANTFLNTKNIRQYNGVIVYTKGRIPSSDMKIKASPGDIIPGTPMVVLINGGSASASEIVAGALQDYKRAIIMGTRSFGKGSVQTVLPLGEDSAIKLTTALYYTPAGREIQARGIIPDVVVPELKVKNTGNGLIAIDESDFDNHISGNNEDGNLQAHSIRKKLLDSQLKIAKEDYQLYEALMMLQGLNAVKQ